MLRIIRKADANLPKAPEMDPLTQAIRQARGTDTVEAFAARVGCSYHTARRWLAGETRPQSTAHVRILVAAGVPEDLLTEATR